MKIFFLVIIAFLSCNKLEASVPIVLSEKDDIKDVRGKYIDFFEDLDSNTSIEQISSHYFNNKFQTGKGQEVIVNKNFNATYWLRITIINQSSTNQNWLAELYDFRIENIQVYQKINQNLNYIK